MRLTLWNLSFTLKRLPKLQICWANSITVPICCHYHCRRILIFHFYVRFAYDTVWIFTLHTVLNLYCCCISIGNVMFDLGFHCFCVLQGRTSDWVGKYVRQDINALSHVYSTWNASLNVGFMHSNTMSWCNNVKDSISNSSTVSSAAMVRSV